VGLNTKNGTKIQGPAPGAGAGLRNSSGCSRGQWTKGERTNAERGFPGRVNFRQHAKRFRSNSGGPGGLGGEKKKAIQRPRKNWTNPGQILHGENRAKKSKNPHHVQERNVKKHGKQRGKRGCFPKNGDGGNFPPKKSRVFQPLKATLSQKALG